MPTGSGKSLVQALIVDRMLTFPNIRVLLLTHQRWLIEQNVGELVDFLDGRLLSIGIYSAGLKRRDTHTQILFAGIQSVHGRAWELGFFDLILIDECQRVPQKSFGTYRKFLDEMFKINPKIIIGGLSATPYRLGTGMLNEGVDAIFDDICHVTTVPELINKNHFKNKDHTQYLCKVISKGALNKADLTGVHVRGGEYIPVEMEAAFNKSDLISRAVKEIKTLTFDRKKILVFCAGIMHCEAVEKEMIAQGLDARCIHSQKSDEENQRIKDDHLNGKFKYLLNIGILTTGYNDKAIDCICLLFSTKSPGFYAQVVGRGLRMSPGKDDCLVLDFGGNIVLHGPIDKIEIRKKKDGNGREVATAPQKECPSCQQILALAVMVCPSCGYIFPQSNKHDDTASEADILSKWKKPIEYDVVSVEYYMHVKPDKPASLCVEYKCDKYNITKFREYICIEHVGFAKRKADKWIQRRYGKPIDSIEDALLLCNEFEKPIKIMVDINDKWPKITSYIFEPKKTLEQIQKEKEAEFDKSIEALL
jgi:DNA repair protein RadD